MEELENHRTDRWLNLYHPTLGGLPAYTVSLYPHDCWCLPFIVIRLVNSYPLREKKSGTTFWTACTEAKACFSSVRHMQIYWTRLLALTLFSFPFCFNIDSTIQNPSSGWSYNAFVPASHIWRCAQCCWVIDSLQPKRGLRCRATGAMWEFYGKE